MASLPFLARWGADDLAALRRLTSLFLDEKEFSGAGGLEVTDAMAVRIAVQACLPVLRLGLQPYRGFVGIVVHPDEVVAAREVMDDDGVVHNYDEVLSGEAMEGGPLMLSWTDVHHAGESADWAYNVVIHEFAHVIDMGDGEPDGVPPLASMELRQRWRARASRPSTSSSVPGPMPVATPCSTRTAPPRSASSSPWRRRPSSSRRSTCGASTRGCTRCLPTTSSRIRQAWP